MPTRIAKYALGPLFVIQGLRLRRRVLNLPEPEGLRRGRIGQGQPLRLLIVGDSSAAGVGVCTQDKALSGQLVAALAPHLDITWQLEAKTGDTTKATLRRLQHLPETRFDAVVQALGVNDVTSGITASLWMRRQRQLHQLCRNKFGAQRFYISGLPPMRHFPLLPRQMQLVLGGEAERFDSLLQRYSEASNDMQHIAFDQPLEPGMMARDGFHPGAEAYRLWGEALADRLLNDFTMKKEPA